MSYGDKKLNGGHAASHPPVEPFPIFVSPATGGEKNVIGEDLVTVACWKLSDIRFEFDSCFVNPDSKAEFEELEALRKVHAGCPLSIFGHADPTGDENYNKDLSGRRAEAIHAILTHNAAAWLKFYTSPPAGKTWGLRETQMMLTAVGFDTGGATGVPTATSTGAVKAFQLSKGLKDDGDPGPKTREALIPAYMAFLWPTPLQKSDFLAGGADAGGKGDMQGCSEFNPVMIFSASEAATLPKAQRDSENAVNRRVMILLFRKGTRIVASDWPCPRVSEGVNGCKARFHKNGAQNLQPAERRREFAATKDTFACRFYQRRVETSPCEGVVVPVTDPNTIQLALDSPHFLPGEENLELTYTITGPLSHVVSVEAVVKRKEGDKAEVARFPIPGPYNASGKFDWLGGNVTDPEMDTFLALKKSPYEVQLILTDTGGNKRESNKELLEVLVHSVEIKVDLPAGLSLSAADKKAVETLKTALDGGTEPRLILDSTLFKTRSSQMNDDTATDVYETKWKNGPTVPFLAKLLLRKKDNTGLRSVKVLKGARVLWNMRFPDDGEERILLATRGVHAAADTFITKVSAHKKDASEPKGRTAHMDLRGMRGTQAARDGASKNHWKAMDSAWKMTKAAQRIWNVHTECGTGKFADYDTGVFFLPGRMAGDTHMIKACADHDGKFDTADQTAFGAMSGDRSSSEQHFTIWRRILIHKNYYSGAATTPLNLADLDEYHKAAVLFEAAPGLVAENIQARWKTAYQTSIAELGGDDPFIKAACMDDPELWAVKFKDWNAYKDARTFGLALFGPSESQYPAWCDDRAETVYLRTAKEFPFSGEGMTLFRFTKFGAHNKVGTTATVGLAPAIDGFTDRTHGVFFVFKNGSVKGTFIHEVGHTVFLAHARGHFNNPTDSDTGDQPAGWQQNAHDAGEYCVMSYHGTKPTNLCGLCQLKLRGWDYMKIDRTGAVS